jgi:UDP-N-acetylglucosamine--N-acetylmuramyl-(pentapeptide) pyrophosphoryl-undecaprenol N-acetylglucosamine transferase
MRAGLTPKPNETRPELDSTLRVLIAGGGTGGHIIPALAIADVLRNQYSADVRFVGTARGLETRLVPQAGYPLELIHVGQLKNVSLATRARTLLDLPLGVLRCGRLLHQFRPHVVVGVGGYASGPVMFAALFTGVPTLAFEPNAVPGLVNRWIGKRVSAAAVNFPPAQAFFRNVQVTGIPVRDEFFRLPPRLADAAPHLLVFGGSQGARVLNEVMPQIAADLLFAFPALTILHQAGARHAEATQAVYQASDAPPSRYEVHAFLDGMASRFAAADLVLARSGASTCAELAAAAKPSLLVPFPLAADDHQRRNAEVLVAAGAARMLLERDLTPASLLATLQYLLDDRPALLSMSERARTLARPNAAEQIAGMVVSLSRPR